MGNIRNSVLGGYNYLYNRFGEGIFNIGIIDYTDDLIYRDRFPEIRWLQHGFRDRWFADPFILSADNETVTLLVEAYIYTKRKGVIGKITAGRQPFTLLEYETVLESDTHLSFPAIRRDGEHICVYPENCHSRNSYIYLYDPSAQKLTERRLLSPYPLVDAALFEFRGENAMIATLSSDPHGTTCTVLLPDRENVFEPYQTIALKDNSSRGAGLPFTVGDKLIRPAQNCNGGYGVGIVFQEINKVGDTFTLTEVGRFDACDPKYDTGFHTFNKSGDIAIVDGYRLPPRFVKKTFAAIQGIINRISKK